MVVSDDGSHFGPFSPNPRQFKCQICTIVKFNNTKLCSKAPYGIIISNNKFLDSIIRINPTFIL